LEGDIIRKVWRREKWARRHRRCRLEAGIQGKVGRTSHFRPRLWRAYALHSGHLLGG
jgi:hypothetical protein